MKEVWEKSKEIFKDKVSESSYKVWIEPLRYLDTQGNTIVVSCPNQFFASWVQENYLPLLRDHLAQSGRTMDIKLVPVEREKAAACAQLHLPKFSPTELPRPRFCHRFTFSEFVVGSSNEYAYSACLATAEGAESHSNIIYLHADSGLGKSHLVQALGQRFLEREPNVRLCYLTANEFTNQVVKAIKNGEMESFKRRYRQECDVLLLEQVHSLSGRERTQIELALALDPILDTGKTVVFTGNKLPRQISKLNDSLRSRLSCGLITSINPPDYRTRQKIVARKAKSQGIMLEPDMVDFLARNLKGDIRRIEGAVIGLIAKSSILKRPIDMDLAKEVLGDIVGEPAPITLEAIKKLVCKHFKLTVDEIRSKSRKRSIARPRQIAMFLSRRFTEASLEAIGREFNRDHATVLHSVKRIKKELESTSKMRHQLDYLIDMLEKGRWMK